MAELAGGALSAEHSAAVLDALFHQAPVGLAIYDTGLRYVRVNRTIASINGVPAEDHIGRRVDEILPDLPELHEALRSVLATGNPLVDVEVRGRTPASADEEQVRRGSYFPVRDAEGRTSGVAAFTSDVTEERRAQEAQERLHAVVVRQGAILREVVARVPVGIALLWGPEYRFELVNDPFDDLIPHRGEVFGKTVAEVFPDRAALLKELFDPVRETGEPLTLEDYGIAMPGDPRGLDGVRYYSATTVAVPGAGPEDSGVLVVFNETTESVRKRQSLETELEEEQHIAQVLQQSLRPSRLPEIPGVELAARFRASGRRNLVGGDFYDVFGGPEGTWLLVLGDVCGKGAEAAAVTSLARHTLRAAGLFTAEPPALLEILNESMLRAELDMRFLTAVCARLEQAGEKLSLCVSIAGHCCPLVVRADGSVEQSGGQGQLLGIVSIEPPELEEVELHPGDTVVFFTDGITDAGAPERTLEGDELRAVLAGAAGLPAGEMLARLEAAAVPPEVGEPRDDIAMLALGRPLPE